MSSTPLPSANMLEHTFKILGDSPAQHHHLKPCFFSSETLHGSWEKKMKKEKKNTRL
jgi:hypothetical protein